MKLRIYKYSIDIATARLLRLSSVLLLFCIGIPTIAQQHNTTDSRTKKRPEEERDCSRYHPVL